MIEELESEERFAFHKRYRQAWVLADPVRSGYTVVEINQYTGLQQYTGFAAVYWLSSLLSSGVPYYNVACFLGVRKIKTTGEYTGWQVDQ